MTMLLPDNAGSSTGESISPTPSAIIGRLYMKNGQSAPTVKATSAILASLSPKPNSSLAPRMANDASAEPPPSPAPNGICFFRYTSRAGSARPICLSSARSAFTTRLFSASQPSISFSIWRRIPSSRSSAAISSRISHHGTGTIIVARL